MDYERLRQAMQEEKNKEEIMELLGVSSEYLYRKEILHIFETLPEEFYTEYKKYIKSIRVSKHDSKTDIPIVENPPTVNGLSFKELITLASQGKLKKDICKALAIDDGDYITTIRSLFNCVHLEYYNAFQKKLNENARKKLLSWAKKGKAKEEIIESLEITFNQYNSTINSIFKDEPKKKAAYVKMMRSNGQKRRQEESQTVKVAPAKEEKKALEDTKQSMPLQQIESSTQAYQEAGCFEENNNKEKITIYDHSYLFKYDIVKEILKSDHTALLLQSDLKELLDVSFSNSLDKVALLQLIQTHKIIIQPQVSLYQFNSSANTHDRILGICLDYQMKGYDVTLKTLQAATLLDGLDLGICVSAMMELEEFTCVCEPTDTIDTSYIYDTCYLINQQKIMSVPVYHLFLRSVLEELARLDVTFFHWIVTNITKRSDFFYIQTQSINKSYSYVDLMIFNYAKMMISQNKFPHVTILTDDMRLAFECATSNIPVIQSVVKKNSSCEKEPSSKETSDTTSEPTTTPPSTVVEKSSNEVAREILKKNYKTLRIYQKNKSDYLVSTSDVYRVSRNNKGMKSNFLKAKYIAGKTYYSVKIGDFIQLQNDYNIYVLVCYANNNNLLLI